MVVSCSAYGCVNKQVKGNNLQFHRFPIKRPEVLKRWVIAVKRKNFQPTKYSFLCSEHFVSDDYQLRPGAEIKWLKEDAVPSVFKGFPDYLQKKDTPKLLIKQEPMDKIAEVTNPVESAKICLPKVYGCLFMLLGNYLLAMTGEMEGIVSTIIVDCKYFTKPCSFKREAIERIIRSAIYTKGVHFDKAHATVGIPGKRLAILMFKLLVVHVLKEYEIVSLPGRPYNLKLHKKYLFLKTDELMAVGFKKRKC